MLLGFVPHLGHQKEWAGPYFCIFHSKNIALYIYGGLHNEELQNLYISPSIIRTTKSRRMRWAVHVARMGERNNVYMLLVGKPEGKRPLGRPRPRWRDNIKMDLIEIGLSVVDWIVLALDRDN
jgi:hypothetical protein